HEFAIEAGASRAALRGRTHVTRSYSFTGQCSRRSRVARDLLEYDVALPQGASGLRRNNEHPVGQRDAWRMPHEQPPCLGTIAAMNLNHQLRRSFLHRLPVNTVHVADK